MTRCVITCLEPGCTRQINYESTDVEVPLYCTIHRTEEGRHSETRIVNRKPISKPLIAKVELVCVKKSCRKTIQVLQKDWLRSKEIHTCPDCGRLMTFHRDVK
jgi:hypothetical protein